VSDPESSAEHRTSYPLRFQPLLCLSAAFLAGTAVGDLVSHAVLGWLSGGVIAGGVTLILLFRFHPNFELPRLKWQQRFPLTPGWLLILLAIGMLRLYAIQPVFDEDNLAFYNGQGKAAFTGIVVQPAQVKTHSTTLTIEVQTIHPFSTDFQTGITPVEGKMRVTTLQSDTYGYGDELRIICTPQNPQNFSTFNYQRYLAARKIYTTCDYAFVEMIGESQGNALLSTIYALRAHAQQTINGMLPPDEAALLSGILLGNEDHIAPQVEAAFQRTGTSHIIAISGANFTVLITFLTTILLRHLPRKWVLPVSLLLITFYTVLVGANAAVVRAAIMGGLSVFGSYFGRRNQGLNALGFSAAVFVFFNPLILWDLGFQLSVGATLGLVLFSERWTTALGKALGRFLPELWAERVTAWVGEYVLMTMAAQVFTLPLIAYTFQRISLSSFFINILILPVQPLIMGLGGLATLIGMLLPFVGNLLGWLAWLPLAYTIRIVTWGSQWQWSEIILPPFPPVLLLGYFAVILAWSLSLGWLPKLKRAINHSGALMLSSSVVIVIWSLGLQQPDEDLHLFLFPLEDSTAILMQFPDGKALLMGRSNSMDDLNHAIQEIQSGYQLSVYIQPATKARAYHRLETLTAQFPISMIFVHPDIETDTAAQLMTQLNPETGLHQLVPNQTIQIMADAQLTTGAVRDESAAFLLQYGDLRVLIPNAVPISILSQLKPELLQDTTVLILNPAQFDQEEAAAWLELPAQMVLVNGELLDCAHCLTTAQHGVLHLRSDGVGIWVEGIE